MTSLHVLAEDEDPHGELARDTMGHIAMALLAFATDPNRHATLYRNYLGRIDPADRDLIVPSLVDKLGLIGTRRPTRNGK